MNDRNETFHEPEVFTEAETGCVLIACTECGKVEEAGELDSGLCAKCEYKQLMEEEQ